MNDDERGRSPELDQVRQMLFPELPPDEGWARIEAAISGASDPERWEEIERLARSDLSGDLLARIRRLRQERTDDERERTDDEDDRTDDEDE
jgi:hypothetical protein